MASLNTSHHQDGGVLLYNGELVLLYCDKVNCEIDNVGNASGRMFLTTHRIVFTAQPINQNPRLQSLAAPFYVMFDLGLEQPIFGANYIRGKVRTNSNQNTSPLTQNQYAFKLKFNKGGAIEFSKAMALAAKQASQAASQTGFSSYNFSTTPVSQYYQAPSDVYQPNYPIGFVLPNQVFNEVPAAGTVYYQSAPPPYPGLVTAHQMQQSQGNFSPYSQVYPVAQVSNSIYETNIYPPVSSPNQYPPQTGATGQLNNGPNPPNYEQINNYPNQGHQMGYQVQTSSNSHQSQYPSAPQQSGYVPNSNTIYPNIPTYEDTIKKGN